MKIYLISPKADLDNQHLEFYKNQLDIKNRKTYRLNLKRNSNFNIDLNNLIDLNSSNNLNKKIIFFDFI